MPALWRRRRDRSNAALVLGLTNFPACLPSKRTGIYFSADITATVTADLPETYDAEALSDAIRLELRGAAADAAKGCDPIDLPAARDTCARHLRTPRRLPIEPKTEFQARITLSLSPDDHAAVEELLADGRRQSIEQAHLHRRIRSFATELAQPAQFLAWWLSQPGALDRTVPADLQISAFTNMLKTYPHHHDEPTEYQVLELLRTFVASFPEASQKHLLLSVMAGSMRTAQRPHLADLVEELLSNHTNPQGQL